MNDWLIKTLSKSRQVRSPKNDTYFTPIIITDKVPHNFPNLLNYVNSINLVTSRVSSTIDLQSKLINEFVVYYNFY